MEEFLKEIFNLCEKYGIQYFQPIINERMDFFKQPSSLTSTSLSGTFSTYHHQEVWTEITKEMSIRFVKKTREKVR